MKIFVTGGTGFIGQHLIRTLIKEKEDVLALVRGRVEVVFGDLYSIDFLKKSGFRREPMKPEGGCC